MKYRKQFEPYLFGAHTMSDMYQIIDLIKNELSQKPNDLDSYQKDFLFNKKIMPEMQYFIPIHIVREYKRMQNK